MRRHDDGLSQCRHINRVRQPVRHVVRVRVLPATRQIPDQCAYLFFTMELWPLGGNEPQDVVTLVLKAVPNVAEHSAFRNRVENGLKPGHIGLHRNALRCRTSPPPEASLLAPPPK